MEYLPEQYSEIIFLIYHLQNESKCYHCEQRKFKYWLNGGELCWPKWFKSSTMFQCNRKHEI